MMMVMMMMMRSWMQTESTTLQRDDGLTHAQAGRDRPWLHSTLFIIITFPINPVNIFLWNKCNGVETRCACVERWSCVAIEMWGTAACLHGLEVWRV